MINDPKIIKEILEELDNTSAEDIRKAVDEALKEGEKMEYRYMIWNDIKKEFQFPRICETTEKGANTCLFNCIGNDTRKDRFQIKKVEKEEAKRIVKELKQKYKAERIHSMIPNIDFNTILDLVKKNDLGGE